MNKIAPTAVKIGSYFATDRAKSTPGRNTGYSTCRSAQAPAGGSTGRSNRHRTNIAGRIVFNECVRAIAFILVISRSSEIDQNFITPLVEMQRSLKYTIICLTRANTGLLYEYEPVFSTFSQFH